MYNLQGKVALVTGAAGKAGLGKAIALRLAAEGADLVVNDLDGAAQHRGLSEVVRELESLGVRALAVTADVSQADHVEHMFSVTVQQFGRIDIVVNNAGAPAGRDRVAVVDLAEDAFDLVQQVNVKGTFLCGQAAARAMVAQGAGGSIINMSSTAGKRGVARFAAYCASKFAVRGFTQSLALELAPHQIRVNAICPGLVATERIDDMASALAPNGVDPAQYREEMITSALNSIPLGRMTETADVANLAAFLASDQASFITGASLNVDGGLNLD